MCAWSLLAVLLSVLAAGCTDWQEVDVAVHNDGPATTVHVTLAPENHFPEDVHDTQRFTYELAPGANTTDHWRMADSRYVITLQAGSLHERVQETFCDSHSFTILVNATTLRHVHDRGDGFFGC